jgi:hypothetical protein
MDRYESVAHSRPVFLPMYARRMIHFADYVVAVAIISAEDLVLVVIVKSRSHSPTFRCRCAGAPDWTHGRRLVAAGVNVGTHHPE